MFISKMGNQYFSLVKKMLDLHATRNQVIGENIANVNTPHYKRRTFSFENALKSALKENTAQAYSSIKGKMTTPRNTIVRHNGNNVDIEKEMLLLGENSKLYQTYSEIYSRKSEMLRLAIRGS